MNTTEYNEAREALFRILTAQPQVLAAMPISETRGKQLAEMAWAFIDEYHRQHKEKCKDGALTM